MALAVGRGGGLTRELARRVGAAITRVAQAITVALALFGVGIERAEVCRVDDTVAILVQHAVHVRYPVRRL